MIKWLFARFTDQTFVLIFLGAYIVLYFAVTLIRKFRAARSTPEVKKKNAVA